MPKAVPGPSRDTETHDRIRHDRTSKTGRVTRTYVSAGPGVREVLRLLGGSPCCSDTKDLSLSLFSADYPGGYLGAGAEVQAREDLLHV